MAETAAKIKIIILCRITEALLRQPLPIGYDRLWLQFSRRGVSAPSGRSSLQEAQRWVAAHPAEDHGVERLASRTGMSPRHFARVFRAETGMTPAAYVETVRIEAVRRLLETDDVALKQVAGACEFRDADTPAEYRSLHAPG